MIRPWTLFALCGLLAAVTASPLNKFDELKFYFQYASSAYLDTCAKPNGNTLIEEFSSAVIDTQGFIARDDSRKEIVVALRGSSDFADALTDINILLVPFLSPEVVSPLGVLVHAGFLTGWNSVVKNVTAVVSSQLSAHPDYTIVTSGHSLGGALSSIAAVSLAENFPKSPIRMYTYGQPRTGDPSYAFWVNDKFGANAFRVIPSVPTLIPQLIGYRHHGIEYWQFQDPAAAANTTQCAADGEDPNCSASIEPSGGINDAHHT
ncbi:alpha/beta-hydrolase [Punctularia strigosozonata HHB-11173 SS5]|uniref:Alpha/beta-hydrolase n=1 Tax=Punctularia strigosozonata (strain HHB-11173) TaxID=741275 RepID=R7S1V2_PUNST|nr:alpha/beta-hydrolase [Punctularia strigosozonata HHB-11173 SS5]EIN03839.1 alpha/beta-hydrolase [Punctularia strigosozonata HHB-11173 SS5]